MTKLVVTLDIDYEPRITEITFPYMHQYAKNIGADFKVINTRKYDDRYPVSLEKLQLYEVSEPYDWTIFLDADLLINPNCFDLTETIDDDMILVPEYLDPNDQFNPRNILNKYNISWRCPLFISVFSSQTRRAFEWPEVDPLELIQYINPKSKGHTHYENSKESATEPQWYIDDFVYNLNIAKYKIATGSIKDSFPNINIAAHITAPVDQKIEFLRRSVKQLENMHYD
jgi:hypothetical protein